MKYWLDKPSFHFHLHIIPRYGENDGFGVKWITRMMNLQSEELEEIAEKIKGAIE